MEIHVAGADAADAVFAHEDRGVSIVEQIARDSGNLCQYLSGNLCMLLGLNQDRESRRRQQRGHKLPCPGRVPWPSHHSGMSGDPQEFIHDRPSRVPGFRALSLPFEPVTAGAVKWRIDVGSINQHIRVYDEH